jgi:hypothetical protein
LQDVPPGFALAGYVYAAAMQKAVAAARLSD